MRIATIVPVLALTLAAGAAGCKKKNSAGEALAKMTDFRDRMCACADKPCADKLNQEYMDWANKSSGGDKPTQMSEDDAKKITDVSLKYNECLAKWSGAGNGSDTGSAGSGSDTGSGSGSAASGSAGSGAEQTAMVHQAGNCPSTVLGSTTTATVKGKDVVLTITATDKDAIAAIQRRTEELVKEKADDKAAGSAHDQKGTFGGGRGICPVYYGEGGSAKSKKDPKGVTITITPKDKPDELKKAIDERITKAAEFVKTIKPGDQGNQGGVGGGSGEHGSDHKGQGDGKGKERKGGSGSGTGGGGGAGTGGGGGMGTGGGGGSGAKAGSGSSK